MPDFRDLVAAAATVTAGQGSRSLWRGLGRAGVLHRVCGQPDVDAHLLGQLLEELDVSHPAGPVLSVCVQVATVIPLLHRMTCDSPLVGEVLDETLYGKTTVALAATDAGLSGSALLDARTVLKYTDGGVFLDGGKEWITNAGDCDYVLVLARHRAARHVTSFSWALVPSGLPGVSYRPCGALFASAAVGHLRFDNVLLPAEQVIGRPGRALAEFARQISTERLAGALWARALCRRVLLDTRQFLMTRSTGDGTLWDSAAVRYRFARCLVEWRRLDMMCTRPRTVGDGMVLKAACGESVDRILGECVNLRGAEAFRNGGMASIREQVAMFGIAGGATGTMLAGIAEHADEVLRSPR